MTFALVPVKALSASKTRLVAHLDRPRVERLSSAMMGDVLEALQGVSALREIAVVTPDAEVARAAERDGARVLVRDDPGLNASIEAACNEISPSADSAALVVLGDVAAAASQELAQLLDALAGPGVALAPSSDGGTSALLRAPFDAIPARFGRDSAKRHREESERARLPYRELALPSLALDIDVAEDLARAARAPSLGPRTRALLDEFGALEHP